MIRRSNRPGRRRAGSRTSGRLVAASTMTFDVTKPPISTGSWLSVDSRSSLLPGSAPRPRLRLGDDHFAARGEHQRGCAGPIASSARYSATRADGEAAALVAVRR